MLCDVWKSAQAVFIGFPISVPLELALRLEQIGREPATLSETFSRGSVSDSRTWSSGYGIRRRIFPADLQGWNQAVEQAPGLSPPMPVPRLNERFPGEPGPRARKASIQFKALQAKCQRTLPRPKEGGFAPGNPIW